METYQSCLNSDVLQTEILYASKAFCIQEMVKLVQAHGLSLDVVSGGELYTRWRPALIRRTSISTATISRRRRSKKRCKPRSAPSS